MQLGRTKERKKEKRKRDRTCTLGWGAEGEERFPYSQKPLHQWGDQLRQRGSFRGSEESAATSLWQAGQCKTYTDGLCHSSAHPSLSRASPGAKRGWVLACGIWRADPERGQMLAVKRLPEGTEIRSSTTGKACGRSPGHHRSRMPLLRGVQGAWQPMQPPSPCANPYLRGY